MPDILHKVGIKSSSRDAVYKALAAVEGLSAELKVASRNQERCPLAKRDQARQLGIKRHRPKERNDSRPQDRVR
jgi:hypothetical protein